MMRFIKLLSNRSSVKCNCHLWSMIRSCHVSSGPVLDLSKLNDLMQCIPMVNPNKPPLIRSEHPALCVPKQTDDTDSVSVSNVLQTTMPEEQRKVLEKWKARMIFELGEEGFLSYQRQLLDEGSQLHRAIECWLKGSPIADEDSETGHWESVSWMMEGLYGRGVYTESWLRHDLLGYRGILDSVVIRDESAVLIDWKTSSKPKRSIHATFDNPLQLAAYVGAINWDPRYPGAVSQGLLVYAYRDGSVASAFELSQEVLERYWRVWLGRLFLYFRDFASFNQQQLLFTRLNHWWNSLGYRD